MSSNRTALERALEHFSDPKSHASYFDLYDPSITLHGYGLQPGIESVKAFYQNAIWEAFPDAVAKVRDVVEDGPMLACRFCMTGTHLGPFMGIPATGKPFLMDGMTFLRFNESGKCVERWSVADFLSILMQIGAFPPPGGAA